MEQGRRQCFPSLLCAAQYPRARFGANDVAERCDRLLSNFCDVAQVRHTGVFLIQQIAGKFLNLCNPYALPAQAFPSCAGGLDAAE